MALREVDPAAMKLIQFFDLPVQQKIITCVQKYSTPDTFCDALVYVVNRICNGVKGIFGRSDWQIAERAIKEVFTAKYIISKILPEDRTLRKNLVTQMLNPQGPRNASAPIPQKKEEIGRKVLEEILDENNKDGVERVEQSLDDKAPKGLLAELVAQKEAFDFRAEMSALLAPIMLEEGMNNHEVIRKELEGMQQEERADHLAFLGLCGLDPTFYRELVQTYLPRQA